MRFCVGDLGAMPWIQLFVSSRCNLHCPYCSNHRSHPDRRGQSADAGRDFLADPMLGRLIESIPPTHFYISGGEPLIHPDIREFVTRLGRNGHAVSFDTNISLSLGRLRELLAAWDREWFGFVNISHHLECGIDLEFIVDRCRVLRDSGLPHFVKYVGVPERLAETRRCMCVLGEEGIGAATTILTGSWKGREFPRDYTPQASIELLDLVTLYTHGLQVFDGVYSRGMLCRGGQDHIALNMCDTGEALPCCHGSKHPTQIERTFFHSGDRTPITCDIESCMGDLMFVYGINGVLDESERFASLCAGPVDFLGSAAVMQFVRDLAHNGVRLVNAAKFAEIERERSALVERDVHPCSPRHWQHTASGTPALNPTRSPNEWH